MAILLIEDYAPLRNSLAKGLREAGFAVDASADGEDGLWHAGSKPYDVIVLDLMLPKLDGLSILRRLRGKGDGVHILLITAKDTVEDRVKGLDLGADDYLVKPFAFEELLARVRALVRRKYDAKSGEIRVSDLVLHTRDRTAQRAEAPLDLTAREFAILELLALRAGKVVSRTEIWNRVYDWAEDPDSNVVDVYVGRLRAKLERGGRPRIIQTRRGMGYLLQEGA